MRISKFILLCSLFALSKNVFASIPSESEFLHNTSAPVVEPFTGSITGQENLNLEIASFGLYWVNNQPVASVWRIRNGADNAQIVKLKTVTQDWQTTLSIPANSQVYVSSPDITSIHELFYEGNNVQSVAVESQITYTLPQQLAETATGYALLTYDLSNGNPAGSNLGQTWVRRELNNEEYDTGDFVSLYNSKFTLKPGSYLIESTQVFFDHISIQKSFKGRIRNVTTNKTLSVGLNARLHIARGESAAVNAIVPTTYFTITQEETFELQYFAQNAENDEFGLGYAVSSGEVERYAYVYIQKIN